MTYPPDATMLTLLAIRLKCNVEIVGGKPTFCITERGYLNNTVCRIVITNESLDALEQRKWIDLSQDQPRVTKLGREAVMTWIRAWKNKRKRRAKR